MTPRISVVIPTHNRPERLARALAALRAQTLAADAFEIVVVDDGSGPETAALLARETEAAGPPLRVIRHEHGRGPATARNAGWRAATGPLIAFTDDDCEPTPRWLEAGLEAWAGEPRRFVQGPTLPNPSDAQEIGHFHHTLRVEGLGPWWETANIFYPRAALAETGGFVEAYSNAGGEDTDLGWTLTKAGYEAVWAPEALVHHAVTTLSPRAKLKLAWRWHASMLVFKRHPELRERLIGGVFWIPAHYTLLRALAALLVPKRLWWLRLWLVSPYFVRVGTWRPDVAAFLAVHDAVEMASCARGAIRFRVLVL